MRNLVWFLYFSAVLTLDFRPVAAAPTQHAPPPSAKTSKPAKATPAGPKLLGSFGGWRAFTTKENGQDLCYASLILPTSSTKALPRGEPRLIITHRPSENTLDVVSYAAGYNFRPATNVKAGIGKNSFDLFTAHDTAWSRDAMTDHKIAKALQNAAAASFTGLPAKQGAKPVTDRFNLKGAADAYRAISKACGLPVAEEKTAAAKSGKKTANPKTSPKKPARKTTTLPAKTR